MRVYILWGQPKEEYVGQHAPRALAVVDEGVLQFSPTYMEDLQKTVLEGTRYTSVAWFPVDITGDNVPAFIRTALLQTTSFSADIGVPREDSDIRDKSITVVPHRVGKMSDSEGEEF